MHRLFAPAGERGRVLLRESREKKMQEENKTLKFQRPAVVTGLALLCCAVWGSAFPFIKIGYQMMGIEDSGSQILYGGARFFLAGLMTFAFAAVSRRGHIRISVASLPAICGQGLLQTTAQYVFYWPCPLRQLQERSNKHQLYIFRYNNCSFCDKRREDGLA